LDRGCRHVAGLALDPEPGEGEFGGMLANHSIAQHVACPFLAHCSRKPQPFCGAIQRSRLKHSGDLTGIRLADIRQVPGGSGSDEDGALHLRAVEVAGDVLVGVDVDIGPVGKIDDRDAPASLRPDLMVRAFRKPADLRA
jgi:hypothetical protein